MYKHCFIYISLLIIGSIDHKSYVKASPEECLGKDYCTVKPNNYPQELIDDTFEKLHLQFPSDIIEEKRLGNSEEVNDIAGTNGCESKRFISHIYKVKDQNGRSRIVVQSEKHYYKQMFRLHECIKPGELCFQDFTAPLCMSTKCVQNYRKYTIVVLPLNSTESNGFDNISVQLPLGCFCRYKKLDKNGNICNRN